jgi:hypothetical protein
VADPTSEQILLTVSKYDIRHNGGQLAFGPDGYLYIGIGDSDGEADPGNVAQQTTKFYGKILRIDVNNGAPAYSVPPTNPFVGNSKFRPEIWAYGLRNPWRFSFDRATGDLYIGDVGQNAVEEINFQAAGSPGGQNYGWRIMEGPQTFKVPATFTNFASLTMPVVSYSHQILGGDAGGSVTGGYVYRGPQSARMDGVYFFGDFIAGWIWGMKQNGSNWETFPLITSTHTGAHYWISTFGEDEEGQIYCADYYAGKILQLTDSGQTWAPVFSPPTGYIPSDILLITSPTANAEVHYTINGGDPTVADPILPEDGQLQIKNGDTIEARAFRSDLPPSLVTTGTFTFQVGSPVIDPGPDRLSAVPNNTVVTIKSATPSATIHFTTNGTLPTLDSPVYTGPFNINPPVTIRAIATAPGFADNIATFKAFTLARVSDPIFIPGSSTLTNGALVSIFSATPGATVHFTVDHSIPTTDSPVYTAPFPLTVDTTVSAIATLPDYMDSQVQTANYIVPPLNLQIDSVTPMYDDTAQVRWHTRSGQNYVLQVSNDLISWTDIGGPVSGNGSIAVVTDYTPFASSDQRFYRIELTP